VAALVRAVDGGAAVALVTLVVSRHGEPGNATAGLLTALLSAPFLLGALAAEPLARARDPRRPLAVAFAGLGAALAACGLLLDRGRRRRDRAVAPDEAVAAVLFALAGGISAAQFTASLAVRSSYAPPGTRAHVYVTMAGLKMGCASAGAALAGGLLALGPRPALLAVGGLILSGSILAAVMRHAARSNTEA
jgi:MFS family permease